MNKEQNTENKDLTADFGNTVLGEVKNGKWVLYKNEWFNIYSVKNNKVLLHPEEDNGISGGEIIEVDICEINFA